jgi:hypothetical protein
MTVVMMKREYHEDNATNKIGLQNVLLIYAASLPEPIWLFRMK